MEIFCAAGIEDAIRQVKPLDVTGLVLLRLVQDLKRVGFEEEVAQAFQEVGFNMAEQAPALKDLEALRGRRTRLVLGFCLGMLTLSVVLTLVSMVAALWHMAWWIGVAFIAMLLISSIIVVVVVAGAGLEPVGSRKIN